MKWDYVAACIAVIWPELHLAGAAELPSNPKIKKLIANLGSDSFKERQEAEKQLREMPEAIPYLEEELSSRDAEVVERCKRILAASRKLDIPKFFARARALAKEGKIELAMELLLYVDVKAENDDFWETTLAISNLVRDKAIEFYGKDFEKLLPAADKTVEAYFARRKQAAFERVFAFALVGIACREGILAVA